VIPWFEFGEQPEWRQKSAVKPSWKKLGTAIQKPTRIAAQGNLRVQKWPPDRQIDKRDNAHQKHCSGPCLPAQPNHRIRTDCQASREGEIVSKHGAEKTQTESDASSDPKPEAFYSQQGVGCGKNQKLYQRIGSRLLSIPYLGVGEYQQQTGPQRYSPAEEHPADIEQDDDA
jgi:hypothetical protein